MKKYAVVLVSLVLILALSLTAFAATGTRELTAVFRDIQILVNGSRVATTEANEPFIVDGTTYLPVRAVGEALNLEVDWNADTNTVSLTGQTATGGSSSSGRTPSAQVTRNVEAARALFTAQGPDQLAELFAADAVYHYSLGTDPDGPMGTYMEHINIPVEEWLDGLAADFHFVNEYTRYNVEPIFTPVNAAYNDLIMIKMRAEGGGASEHWVAELTYNNSGEITKLRVAPDPDEVNYLDAMAAGDYNYTSSLSADELRQVNLHTIELWWSCRNLDRNIQRRILVTADAHTSMNGGVNPMWVADADGNYVSGWLNPDQSGAFPQWGFFALDHESDPDKVFECADLPNVFLVDACGNGINMSSGTALIYQPNYFLQITLRDDGYIVNFREMSHGLNRIEQ